MDSTPLQKASGMIHPGEMVVDYLDFTGWSQSDLARRTGLSAKTISEICNGKAPITPATALALEKVFQRPAHFWLNLQRQFDEAEARRRELQLSDQWTRWADSFPLREMKRRGWLPSSPAVQSDVHSLLTFFGVSSPQSWQSVSQASDVAYRQTRKFKTSVESVSVWLRATELAAAELPVQVADFDEDRVRSTIEDLRSFTTMRADEIIAPIQALCGAGGIVVVWVPELQQTGISGCARWLTDRKALIGLTLRYKTDDQLWFTFFHELGHILLHRRRRSFVVDNADKHIADRVIDPEMQIFEDEAHRFASDTLIPPSDLADFIRAGRFTNETIFSFAKKIGVGPGLVVGRLQHDGILARHQGNAFKQRLAWGRVEDRS